jgi:FkbM family methyltransferase
MLLRPLKNYLRRRRLQAAGFVPREVGPTFRAGARSGVWTVCTTDLRTDSIVYSIGVGDNIAWDLALIERFGVTVHAFDPTPASIGWIAKQSLPPRFCFHPVGVASQDGIAHFRAPRRPGGFNFIPTGRDDVGAIAAPVRRLSTLMADLGHSHIDVLKLDIEGGEYEVLADMPGESLPVRQVLVEFHHNLPTIPFARTETALRALTGAGYRLFHISERGLELSFQRERTTVDSAGDSATCERALSIDGY